MPAGGRQRREGIVVHRSRDRDTLMLRAHRGTTVTGPETTLVALGASLEAEAFEIACEDARRRRLTSIPALNAYLDRFGGAGRPGVMSVRRLLRQLDPVHPSRSTLEAKTRLVLATWTKVTEHPALLVRELVAALAA